MANNDAPADDRLAVRIKQAQAMLGIGKSLAFEMLANGTLERVRYSKRAVGVTMRSIRAVAEGRGIALPTPEARPEPKPKAKPEPEPPPARIRRPRS